MTIFPAQYSTLCAKALGEELSKRYGLANCSCRLLMRNVSDAYLLEASGRQYIFKLYRDSHRKLEEIRGEAALLLNLKENGANVSYPLDDRDGKQLQAFQAAEGQRWGLLFTYATGTPESNLSPDGVTGILVRLRNGKG